MVRLMWSSRDCSTSGAVVAMVAGIVVAMVAGIVTLLWERLQGFIFTVVGMMVMARKKLINNTEKINSNYKFYYGTHTHLIHGTYVINKRYFIMIH